MQYKILRTINSGGFGTVYEVEGEDGTHYALKEVKNLNEVNKQRFDREIKILSQLDHPNIIKIFQHNMAGDPPNFSPWYTMEYLRGGSLRDHMDEKFDKNEYFQRRWTINTIILPSCNALAQAHDMGIVHRDLKPDNILYTNKTRSHIKIADWGLGKDINRESLALTAKTGEVGGTPGYCSPEQWFARDSIDGRADIFSLGSIFFEMLVGQRIPIYDNNMKRKNIHPTSKYHSTVSSELDRCILKMIELDPKDRQKSVWELIAEIESLPDNFG